MQASGALLDAPVFDQESGLAQRHEPMVIQASSRNFPLELALLHACTERVDPTAWISPRRRLLNGGKVLRSITLFRIERVDSAIVAP